MNRIEIRGVIVPSNYDVEWMQPYIAKGIISPESYIRNAIKAAPVDQPLQLYINSPGGSVFAAYEIINTLVAWRAETKQPVNIVVGAMAASAASAIAVLSGANVSVFRNSKFMFHGAWTVSIGGKELHEDTADLLEKINADIKAQLVTTYNIDAAKVDEWFAEGRQGWLSAAEAVQYGIAKDIVDGDDAEVEFDDGDIAQIEASGMAIAALLETVAPKADAEPKQEGQSDDGQPDESNANQGGEPPAGEPAKSDDDAADERAAAAKAEQERIDAIVKERVEVEIGNRTQEFVAKIDELKSGIASRDGALKAWQSKYDTAINAHAKEFKEFEARLATMQTALEQANARASKLLAGSLTFSPEITSWPEALASCGNDYAKAARQYPELARNYKLPK